jgi:hypothetical protein
MRYIVRGFFESKWERGIAEDVCRDFNDAADLARVMVEWNGAHRVDIVAAPKGYIINDKDKF